MRLSVTPRFLSSKKYIFYTSTNPQRHSSEDSEDDLSRKWLVERQTPTTGEINLKIYDLCIVVVRLRRFLDSWLVERQTPTTGEKSFFLLLQSLPTIIHMSDTLAIKLRNIRQMAPLRKSKLFY